LDFAFVADLSAAVDITMFSIITVGAVLGMFLCVREVGAGAAVSATIDESIGVFLDCSVFAVFARDFCFLFPAILSLPVDTDSGAVLPVTLGAGVDVNGAAEDTGPTVLSVDALVGVLSTDIRAKVTTASEAIASATADAAGALAGACAASITLAGESTKADAGSRSGAAVMTGSTLVAGAAVAVSFMRFILRATPVITARVFALVPRLPVFVLGAWLSSTRDGVFSTVLRRSHSISTSSAKVFGR
jgi:hypothetical protein